MEKWKNIKGWEGIYQISSHGRLKSFKGLKYGRILSNINKKGGYLSVILCADGFKNRYTRIHRLVAEAFLPIPCVGYFEVNHKDCDKQNNHIDNLEWVTRTENIKHAIKIKPSILSGINNHNKLIKPKTVIQFTLNGELLGMFPNAQAAAKATGVCGRNIHQVAAKTEYKPGLVRSQAGGFKWEFKEDTSGYVDKNFNIGQREQGELLPCI